MSLVTRLGKGSRLTVEEMDGNFLYLQDLAQSNSGQPVEGPQGPQGIQGPTGPQGLLGPVGPAGLTWQGSWDANTTYSQDDAVGFDGASWFCISAISGTGNDDPSIDTMHWALLASQGAQGPIGVAGAQGPQGPQGPQGVTGPAGAQGPTGPSGLNGATGATGPAGLNGATGPAGLNGATGATGPAGLNGATGATGPAGATGSQGATGPAGATGSAPVKTRGQLYGDPDSYFNYTILTYDINIINDGAENSFFRLPDTTTVGKEVIVDVIGQYCRVYATASGAFEVGVTSTTSQIICNYNDLIKFTSIGANYWQVEYLSRAYPKLNGVSLVGSNPVSTFALYNGTASLTRAQLNSTYIDYFYPVLGFSVYGPNIQPSGLVYVKTGTSSWVSLPITTVS